MSLIELSILLAPPLTAAPGSEQSGVIVADHNDFVHSPFRQTVALERTACAVLGLGIEKAAMLYGPGRAQNAPCRALQNVVLGVITKAAHRHARSDRLGLCRDQRIDATPLKSTVDLRVGIAGIRGNRLDVDPCSRSHLVDLRLDHLSFVLLSRRHLNVEDHAHFIVNGCVLFVAGLKVPVARVCGHRRVGIGHADFLALALPISLLGLNLFLDFVLLEHLYHVTLDKALPTHVGADE
jgi:hypothetical protein